MGVAVAVCSVSFGQERRVPVYGVDTDKKQVAISFDAAWGDEFTEGILDILDTYDVKATFFLVDFWSEKYPDDVKMIAERGHDIGNHSTTHPDMAGLSEEEIIRELDTSADTIESLTGKAADSSAALRFLFQPPHRYRRVFGDTRPSSGPLMRAAGWKTQSVQSSGDSSGFQWIFRLLPLISMRSIRRAAASFFFGIGQSGKPLAGWQKNLRESGSSGPKSLFLFPIVRAGDLCTSSMFHRLKHSSSSDFRFLFLFLRGGAARL